MSPRKKVEPLQEDLGLQIDEIDFIRQHLVAGMSFEEAKAELEGSLNSLEDRDPNPNGEDDGQ